MQDYILNTEASPDVDGDGKPDGYDPFSSTPPEVPDDSYSTELLLTVGDVSESHTEMYALHVGPCALVMTSVGASKYLFSTNFTVLRGKSYKDSYLESLPDPDDQGDYFAAVSGQGVFVDDPSSVLGSEEDTGFNSGMRYFDVYIPDVNMLAHQAGTMSIPGPAVSKAYENKKGSIVAYVNSDNDDAGPAGSHDYDNQAIGADDNDIIKLTLKKFLPTELKKGTLEFTVTPSETAVRIFKSATSVLDDRVMNLASPVGNDLYTMTFMDMDVYVEVLEYIPEIKIKLAYKDPSGTEICSDSICITPSINVRIALDGNRDGFIDFSDAADKQIRFWINNDQDVETPPPDIYPEENPNPEHIPATTADSDDGIIQSERDLEDLTRLHLTIGGILDDFKSGQKKLGLKWKNAATETPSIRIFKACEDDGGWEYIKNRQKAHDQVSGSYGSAIQDASGLQILEPRSGSSDFTFSQTFWSDVPAESDKVYFIFEGVTEGKGDLTPVILDESGNVLGEGGSVAIQLRNIERLYQRAHSTPPESQFPYPYDQYPGHILSPFEISQTGGVVIPATNLNYQTGFDEGESGLQFEQASDEENKSIVFIHGIALTVPEVQCYTASMYKRLWWQGYKGRLVAFRWSTPIPAGAHAPWAFDDGEFHSWSSGRGLMNYVENLKQQMPGATISLVAHSLGNACAGSALRQGLTVDNYVMMEAAVALSTYYSDTVPTNSYSLRLTRVANHTSPDDVADQGYRAFLSAIRPNITGKWVNYHNETDYWLETGHFADGWPLFGAECNWERDQEGKPDGRNLLYFYDAARPLGSRCRNGARIPTDTSRPVEDVHEALAYVAQSQTRAVGAEQATANPRPPGAQASVNLQTYGFDRLRTDHSGQFQRNIQLMYGNDQGQPYAVPLYKQLMTDLNVMPNVGP